MERDRERRGIRLLGGTGNHVARSTRQSAALTSFLFAVASAGTALVAYPAIFRLFAAHDDEGFVLVSLKGILAGHPLYDQVTSQYGPFFYEFLGGVFSALGLSASHDNGRFVTIALWTAASLICGVGAFRMTRSAVFGLCTQLVVFRVLDSLRYEPLQTGGTICFLLASAFAAAALLHPRRPRAAMFVVGAAIACIVFVKINVGLFALMSVVFACGVVVSPFADRRAVRLIVEALFVATPLFLTLTTPWARPFGIHVAISALALVVATRAHSPRDTRGPAQLAWLLAGVGLAGALVCLIAVSDGTSVHGLVAGEFTGPLSGLVFYLPLNVKASLVIWDLLVLAGCVAYARNVRRAGGETDRVAALMALVRIGAGLTIWLSLLALPASVFVPFPPYWELPLPIASLGLEPAQLHTAGQLGVGLPLAWLAVMPLRGSRDSGQLVRVMLPALAVLQALHAYPVAGSQVAWGAFLLGPVGGVCIATGLRSLRELAESPVSRHLALGLGFATRAAAVVVLAWACVAGPLRFEWDQYNAETPLRLPGAARVHLPAREVHKYVGLTSAIHRECSSLVSLPGLSSFYLWARERPPAWGNPGPWMYLLSDGAQRRIVGRLRSTRRPCALRDRELERLWAADRPVPDGPLVHYINHDLRVVRDQDGIQLLLPKTHGSAYG